MGPPPRRKPTRKPATSSAQLSWRRPRRNPVTTSEESAPPKPLSAPLSSFVANVSQVVTLTSCITTWDQLPSTPQRSSTLCSVEPALPLRSSMRYLPSPKEHEALSLKRRGPFWHISLGPDFSVLGPDPSILGLLVPIAMPLACSIWHSMLVCYRGCSRCCARVQAACLGRTGS